MTYRKQVVGLALFLFCYLQAPSQGQSRHITVTVDQPAYVGEPIWVHTDPSQNVHYPFRTGIGDFGCNRLELLQEGIPVPPRRLQIWGNPSGLMCGWVAPPGAPADRLPLHIWFPSLQPGKYAVRWIDQRPDFQAQTVDSVASDWITFEVQAAPEGHREAWLQRLLPDTLYSPGFLAGDYIPNLIAAAPDSRVLDAIIDQLLSDNQVVAGLAASALQVFPQEEVNDRLRQLIHTKSLSDVVARLISAPSFREYRSQFVTDSIRFLDSSNPTRVVAAIEALGFLVHTPNGAASSADVSAADGAVLKIAPNLISSGNDEVRHQLTIYLGSLKTMEAHQLLWKIALTGGDSAAQAHIALTWNSQPEDLPRLAALLLTPGDPDSTGRDLAAIPYALFRGYGESAIPWLRKAIVDSPYVWVRAESAKQLARRSDPVAFTFFLDAVESNRVYRAEMMHYLEDAFPSDLPRNADESEVVDFLKEQLTSNR